MQSDKIACYALNLTADAWLYLANLIFTIIVRCHASRILKVLGEMALAVEATL